MMNKPGNLKRPFAIMIIIAFFFTSIPAISGTAEVHAASKMKGFKAKVLNEMTVSLKWSKLSKKQQKKISGIAIFRNGKRIEKVKKSAVKYIDNDLKKNTKYTYQIKCYKKTYKKKKQWYNKKTKKWQNKKPKKKYRGKRRTVKKAVYKYSNASRIRKVNTANAKRSYKYKSLLDYAVKNNYSIDDITHPEERAFKGPVYYYSNKSQVSVANDIYDSLMEEKDFVIDIKASSPDDLETKIDDLNKLIAKNTKYNILFFTHKEIAKGWWSYDDSQAQSQFKCETGCEYYYRAVNSFYGYNRFATHNSGHYRVQIPKDFGSIYKANINAVESVYQMRNKQRTYDESKYGNDYISCVTEIDNPGGKYSIQWNNGGQQGKDTYEAVKNYVSWNYEMEEPHTSTTGKTYYPSHLEATYSSEDAYGTGLVGVATNRYNDVAVQSHKIESTWSSDNMIPFLKDIGWRSVTNLYKRMYQTDAWEPFNKLTAEQKVILLTAEPMLSPAVNSYSGSEDFGYKYSASDDPVIRNRFTIVWGRLESDSYVDLLNKMADPQQQAYAYCSDIATLYGIIYNSIGADAYYVGLTKAGFDHAILMVRAKDSNGKYMYYMQNNEDLSYIGNESHMNAKWIPCIRNAMGSDYPF